MTENTMTQPRLLQTFLSIGLHGVFEVSIVPGSHDLLCTCPGFGVSKSCKHVRWVNAKLGAEREYQVAIPKTVTPEDWERAKETPETWRAFVTRYVTPEVI